MLSAGLYIVQLKHYTLLLYQNGHAGLCVVCKKMTLSWKVCLCKVKRRIPITESCSAPSRSYFTVGFALDAHVLSPIIYTGRIWSTQDRCTDAVIRLHRGQEGVVSTASRAADKPNNTKKRHPSDQQLAINTSLWNMSSSVSPQWWTLYTQTGLNSMDSYPPSIWSKPGTYHFF